ncbi:MAG: NUMOD1 domain-containing DNA-binding protein [Agriterribacter sp.]
MNFRKTIEDYPYLHKEMNDLDGEEWKDLPFLDGMYRISNLGRVKRLDFEIMCKDGKQRHMKAKMMYVDIAFQKNISVGDYVFFLMCSIVSNGLKYKFSIPRLVYYCFKKKFDLDNYHMVVLTKDGNGKNIHPDNLILVDLKRKQQRVLERNRLKREFITALDVYKATGKIKSDNIACRQVSQYDLNGKKLKTYPSINVASKITGTPEAGIVSVLKGRQVCAHNFVWAYGTLRKIDVAAIRAANLERRNKLVGQPVSQYDLNGYRLAVFDTIAGAAREAGANTSDIQSVLSGRQRSAGGYLWRKGYGKKKINVAGFLTGEAWRAQRRCKKVKQTDARGKVIKIFESVKAASEQVGISASYMSTVIAKKTMIQNYYFKF